jgi:NTP pyrophosphatase (non-canonical NTP hydrolase)
MEEKLLQIIQRYGVNHQLRKFNEEAFELEEAIMNRELNWNYDTGISDIRPFDEHITEELADVCVMLLQFKEYYHIDGNDILRIMNEKINRQLDRMKEEK